MAIIERLNFWLRTILFGLWVMVSSVIGLIVALARFKNVKNNKVYGHVFGRVAQAILGLRVHVEGSENYAPVQPCIYVVNHQSASDMAVFGRIFPPNTVLIGKKQLRYIPIFGLMYEAFGNILIDRKNRSHSVAGLREAVQALQTRGLSILIFPEGTRNSTAPGLLPFKKGAFYMAVEAQVPIVPWVGATIAPVVDFSGGKISGGDYYVRMLPPIPTAGLSIADIPALLEKTRTAMLEAQVELNHKVADAKRKG